MRFFRVVSRPSGPRVIFLEKAPWNHGVDTDYSTQHTCKVAPVSARPPACAKEILAPGNGTMNKKRILSDMYSATTRDLS